MSATSRCERAAPRGPRRRRRGRRTPRRGVRPRREGQARAAGDATSRQLASQEDEEPYTEREEQSKGHPRVESEAERATFFYREEVRHPGPEGGSPLVRHTAWLLVGLHGPSRRSSSAPRSGPASRAPQQHGRGRPTGARPASGRPVNRSRSRVGRSTRPWACSAAPPARSTSRASGRDSARAATSRANGSWIDGTRPARSRRWRLAHSSGGARPRRRGRRRAGRSWTTGWPGDRGAATRRRRTRCPHAGRSRTGAPACAGSARSHRRACGSCPDE